ncbi:GH13387 [Drosophila grimshawi]|uniref:GH13387 n=1 Tax=Drosophila grimshawi TaxID=7222 RepID=B4JPJ5_DROGR|nr:GH13387 [Drosophila grimshawi]
MTESTQLQTAENNNAGVVKMEPPPLATSTSTQHSTSQHTTAHSHSTQQHSQHSLAATAAGGAGTALSPATPPLLPPLGHNSQQHYALKWNDFQTSILSSFRHLRDEEDFVDVTLACDERSFTAHKVVLSACSPYFRKLLKANPCEHPIVILRDVRSDDVENLLSFMYNGEVNVSHEQLPDFLKTAHLLQIRGLADVNGGYPYVKALSAALSHNNNNNNNAESSNHNKISNYLPTANNNNSCSSSSNNNSASNNNNNINSNNNHNNNNSHSHSQNSPFSTPQMPAAVPAATSAAAAAAAAAASLTAAVAAAAAATASNLPRDGQRGELGSAAQSSGGSSNSSGPPAIQELKASAASPASSNHWDLSDMEGSRKSHLTPPPQKRIKSADLFRAQHGISPERLLLDREFPVAGQHPLTRNRSRDTSKDRDRSLELRESLLGQALEQNSNGQQANQKHDLGQSAGEDSNSSDTEPSDRGDGQHDGTLDGMDNQRSHSFPNAFLGLQGIPGLLPGPSGLGGNDFVSRRTLEMRVRATDPRPCPKCGKIYRSAHTLRTHLEDKHTVCPGYRCVLCGTVAKSRNSLHSHMSRQHRGISTKDLPVLPMPSAFDPDLASRLLAKAGVKISPAELRARASPTGGSGSSGGGGGGGGNGGNGSHKLDLSNASGGPLDDGEDSDDDPEDLTTGSMLYGVGGSASDLSRYHESLLSNFGHANTTISRMRNEAAAAAAAAAMGQQKDLGAAAGGVQLANSSSAGQSLLDTYLQFITENTFGMGMSQEHAAAAALHAAKMAQLNAMGHSLDKLPAGLLPAQFDLSKLTGASAAGGYGQGSGGLSIEPILRRDQQQQQQQQQQQGGSLSPNANGALAADEVDVDADADAEAEIRRDGSEPMDLGLSLDNNQSGSNNEAANSDAEDNYSEDEGVHHT